MRYLQSLLTTKLVVIPLFMLSILLISCTKKNTDVYLWKEQYVQNKSELSEREWLPFRFIVDTSSQPDSSFLFSSLIILNPDKADGTKTEYKKISKTSTDMFYVKKGEQIKFQLCISVRVEIVKEECFEGTFTGLDYPSMQKTMQKNLFPESIKGDNVSEFRLPLKYSDFPRNRKEIRHFQFCEVLSNSNEKEQKNTSNGGGQNIHNSKKQNASQCQNSFRKIATISNVVLSMEKASGRKEQ